MDHEDVGDEIRVLRSEDMLAVVDTLVKLKDGIGQVDDIDNLGNRRVRSVGELMQNQYRIGLVAYGARDQRAYAVSRYRNSMPHDLDQCETCCGCCA